MNETHRQMHVGKGFPSDIQAPSHIGIKDQNQYYEYRALVTLIRHRCDSGRPVDPR